MLEVEVKFKLKDEKEYTENLKALGAKYVVDINHTDTYYKLPKGLRDFAKTDEALRLRKIEEIDTRITETLQHKFSADLTYKGPKLDKETKTRKEIVTPVGDPENMHIILQSLDFRPIITLHKYRRLFSLEQDGLRIEILLDKVEDLEGYYSECEIMASTEAEMEAGKKIIFGLMEQLGYTKKDSILTSYLELVILALIKKGKLKPEDVA